MSATLVNLERERKRRTGGRKPYAAYFGHAVNALDRAHHFSLAEWRMIAYAFGQLDYGQRFTSASYRTIAQELGLSKGTVYRVIKKLIRLGVFYRHQQPGDWPRLYLSAYIAYRGKLSALPKVRAWEDLIKAAIARGEMVNIDVQEAYIAVSGRQDDDGDELPGIPEWLEDA